MPRYVAFLRAVNVGRASTVQMDALRRAFEGLGFSNVQSFIASGNIIFDTAIRNTSRLEMDIERGLLQAFGREMTPFIRTTGEIAGIAAFDPFPNTALHAGDQLAVVFLSSPPDARAAQILDEFDSKTDQFRVRGREVYWLRHRNAEGAPDSAVPLDKALREPFTIRSMGTVKKITDKFFSDD